MVEFTGRAREDRALLALLLPTFKLGAATSPLVCAARELMRDGPEDSATVCAGFSTFSGSAGWAFSTVSAECFSAFLASTELLLFLADSLLATGLDGGLFAETVLAAFAGT